MRAIRAYPVLSSPTTVSELRHRLHSHYASVDVVDYGIVPAIVAVARADGGGSPMIKRQLLVNLAMGVIGHKDLFPFVKADGD